jgi:hypothetical protein
MQTLNPFKQKQYYYTHNIFKNIKVFLYNIKMSLQRVKYGFCDRDIYNFNEYIFTLLQNESLSLENISKSEEQKRSLEQARLYFSNAGLNLYKIKNLMPILLDDNNTKYKDKLNNFLKFKKENADSGFQLLNNYIFK